MGELIKSETPNFACMCRSYVHFAHPRTVLSLRPCVHFIHVILICLLPRAIIILIMRPRDNMLSVVIEVRTKWIECVHFMREFNYKWSERMYERSGAWSESVNCVRHKFLIHFVHFINKCLGWMSPWNVPLNYIMKGVREVITIKLWERAIILL